MRALTAIFAIAPAGRAALACVLSVLALTACSGGSYGDLEDFVNQVKARKASRISPLPDFKTYESYSYASSERRDPFEPMKEEVSITAAGSEPNGIRPDTGRHKEALESFPLDSLKFVGHMERNGELWAFVSAPDGLVHRVQLNNYVGQNHGKINRISETEIGVTEIIPDGLGGWIERPASLVLAE